jgi:putative DNA modification/repair radical SAM protein
METARKLDILSDAAKYDASCSSSGSARRAAPGGIGNGAVGGICHTWSSDGRCVSLLKVLLSNACAYDCAYCVNRRSNDIPRTGFEPDELVRLTMDFYKRNYIEGLFLSSGVTRCPDSTMERMIAVARTLRVRERWNGYLHLKAIPGASAEIVNEAARWADRVSVNIELPSAESLARVAPDKTPAAIFNVMRTLARAGGFEPRRLVPQPLAIAPTAARPGLPALEGQGQSFARGQNCRQGQSHAAEATPAYNAACNAVDGTVAGGRARPSVMAARETRSRRPGAAVLPAGQTTQLVVGASPESDAAILGLAENLYLAYDVRRVYYSAFIPSGGAKGNDPRVPALARPPLLREHRLYQADWLFRFYGFRADEILSPDAPFLDPEIDPKCAWALRNPGRFPIEVNTADYLELLRVPGIGPRSAARIIRARSAARLSPDSLKTLGVVMKRAAYFVTCTGVMPKPPGASHTPRLDGPGARAGLLDHARQRLAPLQGELEWPQEDLNGGA